ncbi:MAG: hypothetical protein H0Z29_06390 [Candidatus Marinimicrobia bacterium]|nr:hypothetical protein [Candidatus Neomarinimicrobiota bacterium]
MTLQFAYCNLHFAIAVRLSCPSGNRLRRLREYKTINDLMKLAIQVEDYPARVLLYWFVTEQVEEEDQTSKIVGLLGRIGGSQQISIMLDTQLVKRED